MTMTTGDLAATVATDTGLPKATAKAAVAPLMATVSSTELWLKSQHDRRAPIPPRISRFCYLARRRAPRPLGGWCQHR
jgi:hypothetical protein